MNKNNSQYQPTMSLKECIIGIVILLLCIIGLKAIIFGSAKSSSSQNDYKYSAYAYSKELVRDKLKSPSSADFPIYDPSFVTKKGNTYTVIAYVDAKNSFGTKVRTNYVADITFTNDIPSGKAVIVE